MFLKLRIISILAVSQQARFEHINFVQEVILKALLSVYDFTKITSCMQVELIDASGNSESITKYPLDFRSRAQFDASSQQMSHAKALPGLPVEASQEELQVTMVVARQEIMARAGLQTLGVAASIGRGRFEHILRIAQREPFVSDIWSACVIQVSVLGLAFDVFPWSTVAANGHLTPCCLKCTNGMGVVHLGVQRVLER